MDDIQALNNILSAKGNQDHHIQQLYDSFIQTLNGNSEDVMNSCPILGFGVQTRAETTNATNGLRVDGISSLPSAYSCANVHSPVETTVLDSSGPLDGISMSLLKHAVVELTSESLSPLDQHYSGHVAVVISVDESQCTIYVEVQSDSTKLIVSNFRMLKLSPPAPNDLVRIINRESECQALGTVVSMLDDSTVMVMLERAATSTPFNINNVIRLDSSRLSGHTSLSSNDAYVGIISQPLSSFSTGDWRVNSPTPSSPLDSTSPASSLVNDGNSPGNSWGVSTSCDLPDFAYSISSGSSASSVNCSTTSFHHPRQQPTSIQLPLNSPTIATESLLRSAQTFNSLPTSNFHQTTPTHTNPPNEYSSQLQGVANLYPSLSNESSMYSMQRGLNTSQVNGGVAYPKLPSYQSLTQSQPTNYVGVPGYMLLGGNYATTVFGCQPSLSYQQKPHLPSYYSTPSQTAPLYPKLQHQASGYNEGLVKGMRTNHSSMYPRLPPTKGGCSLAGVGKKACLSPWDEFKRFVSSVPKQRTIDGLINEVIKNVLSREPPQHWYNPLARLDDGCCENGDLSTESVRVSALCPLMKQRMEYPCRGLDCTHLQCFDAKAFLKLALKRRSQTLGSGRRGASASNSDNSWKCPTCGKVVSINQLFIEKYLKKAIGSVGSAEMEFKGFGHWEPYEKCSDFNSSVVIDLTMDSDEDM